MQNVCHLIRDQLSAFMDGELSADQRVQVQEHLEECPACSRELRQFRQLGELARRCAQPLGCQPVCTSIAPSLDSKSIAGLNASKSLVQLLMSRAGRREWKVGSLLAFTVASLVAIAILVFPDHHHDGQHFQQLSSAVNLQPVLERFPYDAQEAFEELQAQYVWRDVALADVEFGPGHANYVTALSKHFGLPGDAKVAATKSFSLHSCPCLGKQCNCGPGGCQCVTFVCQRTDGSIYLVLEQCKSQSVTFGVLPVQLVSRSGREIQLVTVDGTSSISFSYSAGKITAIGLRGDAEIDMLLASL